MKLRRLLERGAARVFALAGNLRQITCIFASFTAIIFSVRNLAAAGWMFALLDFVGHIVVSGISRSILSATRNIAPAFHNLFKVRIPTGASCNNTQTVKISFRFLFVIAAIAALTFAAVSDDEWASYGHDPGGARFSPLSMINRQNVASLAVAWTYRTGDAYQPEGGARRLLKRPRFTWMAHFIWQLRWDMLLHWIR